MARGVALQADKACLYCGKPLLAERHPSTLYCDTTCRGRYYWAKNNPHAESVTCLDCGKKFVKVGAHVVQVHGYDRARDYRIAHGLDYKRGIVTDEHRRALADNARNNGTINNLRAGERYRFRKGDPRTGKIVSNYFKYKRTGVYDEGV